MRSTWISLGWKAKTAVITIAAVVALAVLGAALGDSGTERTSDEPKSADQPTTPAQPTPQPPKPKGYVDLLLPGMTPERAARPLCAKYRRTISNWSRLADQRLASSEEASIDAYAASEYSNHVSWLEQDHANNLDSNIYRTSRTRLRAVTRQGLTRPMVNTFSKDAIWICSERSDYRRTLASLRQLDRRGDRIISLAANVPWYPRGFNDWDGNVAWQWVDNPNCDYFRCSQMRVVTLNGCPDGLYAETNIKSAGTVVDYSNDALGSLGAGETAILTFTDTSEYSNTTASLTEINCY